MNKTLRSVLLGALGWGGVMWIVNGALYIYHQTSVKSPIIGNVLLFKLLVWLTVGAIYGFVMDKFFSKGKI